MINQPKDRQSNQQRNQQLTDQLTYQPQVNKAKSNIFETFSIPAIPQHFEEVGTSVNEWFSFFATLHVAHIVVHLHIVLNYSNQFQLKFKY